METYITHNKTRGLQENVNGLIVTASGTLESANTSFRGARKAACHGNNFECFKYSSFLFVYLCVRRKNHTSNKLSHRRKQNLSGSSVKRWYTLK